jgi:hypothetical protein
MVQLRNYASAARTSTKGGRVNIDHITTEQREQLRQRDREINAWMLTLLQIAALPETQDCPKEEA